ncbi:MAG: sulfotransferase family protein [Candidatus Omnitrophica bacterium]|nr:sulfotransferase family protein [Candidatus Omnitrophota bacterium]
MERVVLFHFHLFKNAGTSIDTILRKNFNEKFVTKEFPYHPYERNVKHVISWIKKEKDKIAFSSHTARLFDFSVLEKEGIKLIPIIFVRHPLIRIYSAYKFEREKQKDINTFATVLARNTDFKGYIEVRWYVHNDHQTRNFHVHRFSDMFYNYEGSIFEKAVMALKKLPFVGIVERFDESLEKLEHIIREFYPNFKSYNVAKNVQVDPKTPIDERLKAIKQILGEEFYKKFEEANKEDIIFWNMVLEMYEVSKK